MIAPTHALAPDGPAPHGTDSHAAPAKPRPKHGNPRAASDSQTPLDARAEVPLHVRPVLNGYQEVEALGICPQRTLRRHIATGRVKRCIIRTGRNLRFVKDILIAELLAAGA